MTNQGLSKPAMIIGIIVVLLSALADPLGLGRSPGFGWRQGLGAIMGLLIILLGYRWGRQLKV